MAVTGTNTAVLRLSASGDAITDLVLPSSVRWIGATTAGHRCSLLTYVGTTSFVLFESEADGANFVDGWIFPNTMWCNGVTLATMQSGVVNLYLASK